MAHSTLFSFGVLVQQAAAYGGIVAPHGAARAAVRMQAGGGGGFGADYVPDNSADTGANYGRLSDKLKEADIERRLEEEEIYARENAAQLARETRQRKIQLLQMIPDETKVRAAHASSHPVAAFRPVVSVTAHAACSSA